MIYDDAKGRPPSRETKYLCPSAVNISHWSRLQYNKYYIAKSESINSFSILKRSVSFRISNLAIRLKFYLFLLFAGLLTFSKVKEMALHRFLNGLCDTCDENADGENYFVLVHLLVMWLEMNSNLLRSYDSIFCFLFYWDGQS